MRKSILAHLSPASIAILVGFVFLAVYLSFPTADYSYDSIGYVGFVHQGTYLPFGAGLWHPYHILYIPMGCLLGRALVALGGTPDALVMMQIVNAVFSAFTLALFYAAVFQETRRWVPSLVATALLGFTNAWWYYSTDPEPYPVCIFFLMLTYIYARKLADETRLSSALLGGLYNGIAVGVHLGAVMMGPAVLTAIFLGHRSRDTRRGWLRSLTAYGAVSTLVALAPYASKYVFFEGKPVLTGFRELVGKALTRESGDDLLGNAYSPWTELVGTLEGFSPVLEGASWLLGLGGTLLRWILAAMLLMVILSAGSLGRRFPRSALILAVWFCSFFFFFTAYNIGSDKFVSFHMVPLFFLFALTLALPRQGSRAWRIALPAAGVVVAMLGTVNFAGNIYPGSRIDRNLQYRKALFVRDHTEHQDRILIAGIGENVKQKVYVPYFAGRACLSMDLHFRALGSRPDVLRLLDARIREFGSGPGELYLISDILDDPEVARSFDERHELPAGSLEQFLERYEPRLHAEYDESFKLVRLTLPPDRGSTLSR